LRKIEMKELKAILTKEEYAGLKGVLWALRKRHENLEPEEQALLDRLFEASPLFDKKHSKNSGCRAIRRWMAAVRESGLNCFDNFLTTLETRMDLITNYFISRSSSGWVEGLNNKSKVLKQPRLWGYKSGEAFAH
jgi:transposase